MQSTEIIHNSAPSGPTLTTEVVIGAALVLGLIGYAVHEYPTSISEGGATSLITAIVALAAYGAAGLWMRRRQTGAARAALVSGAQVGLVLGAFEIVNISLETSGSLSQSARGIVGPVSMAMLALLYGTAGSIAYRRTMSLALAVGAGVWCALVVTVITCLFAFSYNLASLTQLSEAMHAEYLQSGMHDARAFVVRNTLDAASSHLLVSPLIGAFFSGVGALITERLTRAKPSTAAALGLLGVCQLALSIGLIHYALSLTRPERPPFIMTGMLLGGIALTYAAPVATALIAAMTRGSQSQPT